ncbi:hypothetical protein OAG71_01730 [bacterium]|nr:hypothetical protein [bacterium]
MSEEYVSTSVGTDPNVTEQDAPATKAELTKRAYAIGADRGCQLKTTDLFPKQLWVIALCGIILLLTVIGLNFLNAYAPQWRPYIGDASVRAISLSGPGTLASWMLCVTLLTTALASLQIFALRKHRCDDYGGTYRIWLIVPPIFFVASVAAIVDFGAIFAHLTSVAQLTSIANESLIPMTIKLSIVALLMVRLLFEIRESKAAFAMLVVAWLTLAISTVLNTRWAEHRISSQDLAVIYPNAVIISAISLMLAHLFYVRFVYRHAHGEIAIKKRKPAVAKTKTVKPKKTTETKTKRGSTTTATSSKKTSSKPVQEPATSSKKQTRKKGKSVEAAPQVSKPTAEPTVEASAPAKSTTSSKKKSATMSDFQSLLKQKQAQKQAEEEAKTQAAASQSSASQTTVESSEDGAILKMSKAERRRARKAAKAKRRAA